jgi:hypothetical protein
VTAAVVSPAEPITPIAIVIFVYAP